MWVHGSPIVPDVLYSVSMNYYMAYGMGEFTPGWDWGVKVTIGPADIDALVSYIRKLPVPVNLTLDGRVVRVDSITK